MTLGVTCVGCLTAVAAYVRWPVRRRGRAVLPVLAGAWAAGRRSNGNAGRYARRRPHISCLGASACAERDAAGLRSGLSAPQPRTCTRQAPRTGLVSLLEAPDPVPHEYRPRLGDERRSRTFTYSNGRGSVRCLIAQAGDSRWAEDIAQDTMLDAREKRPPAAHLRPAGRIGCSKWAIRRLRRMERKGRLVRQPHSAGCLGRFDVADESGAFVVP